MQVHDRKHSGEVIAQGHAHEVQGSSNINKTSYVENCETSAVGRALGHARNRNRHLLLRQPTKSTTPSPSKQEMVDNPHVQKLSKKLDAPVENIMDKAVAYIKRSD